MRLSWCEGKNWPVVSAALAAVLSLAGCAGFSGVSGFSGPAAEVDGKIGVIDAQRIFEQTIAGKKAKELLVGFSKNRQALMELEEKELRRMEEDLVKQASILSPAARREREEQFRRRVQEYQQKAGDLNREVQEKQKDVLEEFREKVEIVSAKVAKRLGLQIIVDKSKGGSTIYHEKSLDVSEQIIEEFNREYP